MRIFLLAALFLFAMALIAALNGTVFATTWNVWLCGGLIAWVLDQITAART